jgi:hypothetical protein
MPNPKQDPPLKKRVVNYYLFCVGRSHDRTHKNNTGVINPGTEHWHRADPYLVRCQQCYEQEKKP